MGENDGGRVVNDCWPEDFAGVDEAGVQRANCDRTKSDYAMLGVKQNHDKLFAWRVGEKHIAGLSGFYRAVQLRFRRHRSISHERASVNGSV